MSSSSPSTRRLFLWLTVLISILVLWPSHNFQDFLAPGDHGRDLYAGQAILRGESPYRDFWWVYGPLMPYYFAGLYKILGIHITTLIFGKLLLKVAAAVFIYLALSRAFSPLAAFCAAIWFAVFHQDFFFTYNHIGGIALIMAIAWGLCTYIQKPGLNIAFGALGSVLILCLIKINFGLAAAAVLGITVAAVDYRYKISFATGKKIFYVSLILGLPLLLYAIYASMLHGLTLMEIRQCLPYWGDDQPYNTSPWIALQSFAAITWKTMHANWMNVSFAVILWGSMGWTLWLWIKGNIQGRERLILGITVGVFSLFYAANFHEFIKSGVWYRCFWAQPFSMMLSFILIDTATRHAPRLLRSIVFAFVLFMAAMSWLSSTQHLETRKNPTQAFDLDGQRVYLGNQNTWIQTVAQTTAFLKKNLSADELFFAMPYDCLYYYLTGKKSPTRQLIFFDHIKIPTEQEQSVIGELEAHHVNYVVISNRAWARLEPGLGMFGQSYCPLLAQYIKTNFTPVARFGDWSQEPGWAWNHGTLILKRK